MTELILTETERLRQNEDQRISAEFRAMRAAHPEASTMRIVRSLAASGKFSRKSISGIRSALIRTGAYTVNA
ncbi:MAG: hypothetical protein IJ713_07610 [Oscillibacter sp.]|nr:hypothetical protein [Oscillibacter sp.]MBR1690624.1 hypothetical protein [Oscillibacter sp.]